MTENSLVNEAWGSRHRSVNTFNCYSCNLASSGGIASYIYEKVQRAADYYSLMVKRMVLTTQLLFMEPITSGGISTIEEESSKWDIHGIQATQLLFMHQ